MSSNSASRNYCIRSEECNVLAGFYKIVMDEQRMLLTQISERYGIPYDELVIRYCPQMIKFENNNTPTGK